MLVEFEKYLKSLASFPFQLSKQGTKSIVVEVADERLIARFTVWEDGSYVAEVIDMDTEHFVLDERVEFDDIAQLKSGFGVFLKAIGRP